MTRLSAAERTALDGLRTAADDASSAPSLAGRALAILQAAIGFDEAYILAVDPESLLFTRLLAWRGDRVDQFASWLRDVYLVVDRRAYPEISFPALIRDWGGIVILHERVDRWIGSVPRPTDPELFARIWRGAGSPPGGGLRASFADRGRPIAAMQAGRWQKGDGFRPHDAEILRRIGPALARALRVRLEASTAGRDWDAEPPPDPGHLLFSPDRRLAFVDGPGEAWVARIPDDSLRARGLRVPVAAQSLVNHLASDPAPEASVRLVDRRGSGVQIRGTRAGPVGENAADRRDWTHVTIQADAIGTRLAIGMLTARQREVALSVAHGLGDRAIAARLGVSPATVHDHVAALHAAFGTRARVELVAALSAR
jgi:DNA-binding CsgD family transcriptional regulator